MDVRIGVTYSPKELELELDDDADAGGHARRGRGRPRRRRRSVLWLTDRRAARSACPAEKIAYVEIGAPGADRRIGFAGA